MIEDMDMPSTIIDQRLCSVDNCSNPATIADKCEACHDTQDPQHTAHMQYLYDHLVSIDLGANQFADKAAWIAACKERTIPRLARLRAKRDMGAS